MTSPGEDSLLIPAHFNGPRESGNGGYTCGAVAALIEGPAQVSLRSPVPLDEPLDVERTETGMVVSADETLIALGESDWTAGDDGFVQPAIVWAVLDCPTFFAAYAGRDELPVAYLVRQQARLDRPVSTGEEQHVVIAWPIESEGRKALAGSAVLSAHGETLAVAKVLMVEPSG